MNEFLKPRVNPVLSCLKVLAVDDNQLNLKIMLAMLQKMGHEVTLASNGEGAIMQFDSGPCDLVLLDVNMYGMNGFEVARHIRVKNPWVPIFFISSSTRNEDVVEGLKAGGDDYLFKPLNYEILQSKIAAFQIRMEMSEKLRDQNQRLMGYRERIEDETIAARDFIKQFIALDKIDDPLVKFMLKPAEKFSGDLIAVARTPDKRLHVLLADSAGHGLTAALAVIPITQPFYQMTAKGFELPAIVREINWRVRDYLPLPRFVAAVMVSLNQETQAIQVWNGGCPDAVLVDHDGSKILHRFKSNYLPLGVMAPKDFNPTVEYYSFAGDEMHIMMCSDGTTELSSGNGEANGHEGLLSGAKLTSGEKLFDRLSGYIDEKIKHKVPDDDIALVLVDCIGPAVNQVDTIDFANPQIDAHRDLIDKGQALWKFSVILTATQLRRMDVVPFLLNIAGQVEGGGMDGKIFLVLSELFNNALDHGLLNLDSELKDKLEGMEHYYEERTKRLALLEAGTISIQMSRLQFAEMSQLEIFFKDSGDGFEYKDYDLNCLNNNVRHHGRGIGLLKNICSNLEYHGNGSEVTAWV